MNLKEIFQRGKPDEDDLRGELVFRIDQLFLNLPQKDTFTSEITVEGKLASLSLLKLFSIEHSEELTVGVRVRRNPLLFISAKETNATICVFGDEISIWSNCPALMDGRTPDHCWKLLEEILKLGEQAVHHRKKLDSRTSSS